MNRKIQNMSKKPKYGMKKLSVGLVSGLLAFSMMLTPIAGTLPTAYAAQVDPGSEASWIDAFSDGSLAGDTAPVVEGTGEFADYTHATGTQQSKSIGKVIVWDQQTAPRRSGKSEDEVGPSPWAFNPVDVLLKHYGVSSLAGLEPYLDDLGLITTEGIPYMISGLTFNLLNGTELFYVPEYTDYSKMSPLGSFGVSSYTFNGIGTWEFPSTNYDSSTPITSGNDFLFSTKFTPVKAYAGPVPALPIYINDANGDPQLHYLTTDEADPTVIEKRATSRDLYNATGGIQTQTTQVTINSFTKNDDSADNNARLDFTAQYYRLLDPNAPAGTEGTTEIKKDGGTYSFTRLGQVVFTPDVDYEAKAKAGEAVLNAPLEGVDIVFTQPVTSEIVSDGVKTGSQTLDSATVPLYKLPKDDPRRTWVVQRYQPEVKLEFPEIHDLYAFGKIGTTITATPNYAQPEFTSAVNKTSISFLNGDGSYPATPIRTKVVPNEGTWTIDSTTGNFIFKPNKGFAGQPTPVDYKFKTTNGTLVKEAGTVTYEYSDTLGMTATTTDIQGETQTSFDRETD